MAVVKGLTVSLVSGLTLTAELRNLADASTITDTAPYTEISGTGIYQVDDSDISAGAGTYLVRVLEGTLERDTKELKWNGAAEEEAGTTTSSPFLNTKVPDALTVVVGNRADRSFYNKRIKLAAGERRVVQWSYERRAGVGDVLDSMTLPTTSDTAVAAIVDEESGEKQWGVENLHAKVTIQIPSDPAPAVGAVATIRSDVTPEGSEVDKAVMVVEIVEEST